MVSATAFPAGDQAICPPDPRRALPDLVSRPLFSFRNLVRSEEKIGYGVEVRQKPADLPSAFAGSSTEPPRASWGRSTRFHSDCRV